MKNKNGYLAWLTFTVLSFLILLIGFEIKTAISLSIIFGFICGLLGDIIYFLNEIRKNQK